MKPHEAGTEQVAAAEERRGPGHTASVAMIGAGQLARMTFQAAVDLDIRFEVLAEHPGQPAARAGAPWREGGPTDAEAIHALAAGADVVTLDHELVPLRLLEQLADAGATVRPGTAALRMAADKLHARSVMAEIGFPVPRFRGIESIADLVDFTDEVGWPIVLKSRNGGYDGRGVAIVADMKAAEGLLDGGGTWIAEEHVDIARELSVIVARRPNGEFVTYPVAETFQSEGICRELVMPADIPGELAERARGLATSLVSGIDATGVVAVEMFVTGDGELIVCELAVRPHNSGHATIEGCVTSQFQNHLRGILDWPLGSAELRAPAVAMVNVLGVADGGTPTRIADALAVEGTSLHLYGKTELPGRKIGHVTATGQTREDALERARSAAEALGGR